MLRIMGLTTAVYLGALILAVAQPSPSEAIHYIEACCLPNPHTQEPMETYCTAWSVTPMTLVTAAHCTPSDTVRLGKDTLTVLRVSQKHDLALIRAARNHLSYLRLVSQSAQAGEPVRVYSRVSGGQDGLVVDPGHMIRVKVPVIDMDWFLHFMRPRLVPGQSGSPVLNDKDEVVGVAVRISNDHTIIVPAYLVKELLYGD